MTMDSDSASQDSDDGRRFRFETTRKDSNTRIDVRENKSSSRRETSRRSHSRDRKNNHERRGNSRSRQDHRNKRRESRDSLTRDTARHSRDSEKTTNHREATFRGSSPKFHRRESRIHERKNPEDRPGQDKKCHHDKSNKFHERKRVSRERSRERNSKILCTRTSDFSRSPDKLCDDSASRRKWARNEEGAKKTKKRESPTVNDRRSLQRSKNLKTIDFEAVSDEAEDSLEKTSSAGTFGASSDSAIPEKCQFSENDEDLKKRVSKQHYERLMKRQATKKRRSNDELDFPKDRNNEDDEKVGYKLSSSERTLAPVASTSLSNMASDDTPVIDRDVEIDVSSDRITISEIYDSDFDDSRSNDRCSLAVLPSNARDDATIGPATVDENIDAKIDAKIDKSSRIVGPFLPENFRHVVNNDEDDGDIFGPALPPHLTATKNLDEHDDRHSDRDKARGDEKFHCESEDEDFTGPLPIDHPAMENDIVQQRLEMRARRLKAELAACDNEEDKKREEWMIELPPAKSVNLGLGPRKFRLRPAPDMSDRSSWTDTPADRHRKRMEKLENRSASEPTVSTAKHENDAGAEREKSRKREKSLLEMHRKKMQKKKKKEQKEAKKNGKIVERRPFDRDVDLQANRFDEARKKSMFLNSRKLDDRFSRGQI